MTDTLPQPAEPAAPAGPTEALPDARPGAHDPSATSTLSRTCGSATFLDPRGERPASDGLGALMTEQVPAVLSEAAEAPETVAAVVLDAPAATDATVSPVIPELSPAECAARLAALFPAVFTPGTPRPLKLRIQADVQQRAPGIFTKKTLSIFLHRHTTGNGYLKALANAPSRFDLDGQPAGEVSDEHRQAAAAEFDRRRRLHEERRAAERETRRLAYDQARRARAADPGPLSPDAPAVGAPPAALRADSGPRPRRAADDGHRDRAPTDAAPHRRRDGHEMRGSRRAGAQPPAPRTAGDPMPDLRPVTQRPADARSVPATPPVARPVMDEAQRARAALLHAFETTTLTRANFCALKGWSDADLEVALVEARREREQRGPVPRPNPAPQGAAVSRDAPQRPPRGDTGRRGPPGSPRPPR